MNASELEAVIEAAFQNVKLDGGVSLRQAKVIDNYGRGMTKKEFDALPQQEITEDWTAIPDEVIYRYDYLSHLDAKGFRYYLPAFMRNVLRQTDDYLTGSVIFHLYPKKNELWDYRMMHYSLLEIVCPIFCKSSRFEIEQTGFYRKSEAISF